MTKILVLNGPNLNLLASREPDIYGGATLAQINAELDQIAQANNVELVCMQSNHEGVLIDTVQNCLNLPVDFIIINPAALAHTSIGLRDALLAVKIPFVEVHLSNIYAREEFRHYSYLTDIAVGVISGLGNYGYVVALNYAIKKIKGNH